MNSIIGEKDFIKLMWLPENKSNLWKMIDESEITASENVFKIFSNFLDIKKWSSDFESLHLQWLNDESQEIFDLENPINVIPRKAIEEFNRVSNLNYLLFYWYDCDRTDQDFDWRRSPISDKLLLNLGKKYYWKNRLVSLEDYLVLPDSEQSAIIRQH